MLSHDAQIIGTYVKHTEGKRPRQGKQLLQSVNWSILDYIRT